MPIVNRSASLKLPHTVYGAETASQRLLGFLALAQVSSPKALYIRPCSGIHTFSMDQPLGIAFLSRDGVVLRLEEEVPPGRIIPFVRHAHIALEWPADPAMSDRLHVGDRLEIEADAPFPKTAGAWTRFLHGPVNYMLALFWLGLAALLLSRWLDHPSPAGLGLLIYNSILAYLFIVRRPSITVSRRWRDWFAAVATLLLSFSLRPVPAAMGWLQIAAIAVQCCAIMAIIAALASLGKSLGIVPANRRVKTGGAYRLVRHPLYATELLFYAAFLAGNGSRGNLIKILLITAGQIYRALAEERLLENDPEYRAYQKQVRFRFIPFVI
jgi:protein-S-isoprenylcysteine O-methyltransferase Ste14/uncharacterized membrane protein (UPF0127 family)